MGKTEVAALLQAAIDTVAGGSQRQAARMTGLSPATINGILKERFDDHDHDTYAALAYGKNTPEQPGLGIDIVVWLEANDYKLTEGQPDRFAHLRGQQRAAIRPLLALSLPLAQRPGAIDRVIQFARFLIETEPPDLPKTESPDEHVPADAPPDAVGTPLSPKG